MKTIAGSKRKFASNAKDLSGKRFGRLVAISPDESRKLNVYWKCLCDCGKTTTVRCAHLSDGGTVSCGCVQQANRTTHGKSHTPENKSWKALKSRCLNVKNQDYKNYGGRGISVCDRWLNSFENFYADMGIKPSKEHSIDRINVNGNYEPSNCRWATSKEQSKNKRKTRFIEYLGQKKIASEWGEIFGIGGDTIASRIRRGWTIEKSLTFPIVTY